MLRYAIVAPPYNKTSAGIVGLWDLRQDLEDMGCEARVIVPSFMPPVIADDEIVVYPDCVVGNPFMAKKVVRYLLMYAGYFGQDKDFPESEYMYYYCRSFILNGRNPDNLLTLPVVDDRFKPWIGERSGSCYLAIKYQDYFGLNPGAFSVVPPNSVRITKSTNLPELFRTVRTLYTFDNSAINMEAAISGVEVKYVFNERFRELFDYGPGFNWNNVTLSYQQQKIDYVTKQLPQFIARTQARFQ